MTPDHIDARHLHKGKKKSRPKENEALSGDSSIADDQTALMPELATPAAQSTSYEMGEEYLWQIYFDKGLGKYLGSVLEFPEVRAEGISKEKVMQELSHQVQQKLVACRMNGERAPEPIVSKTYPEKLVVAVSQTLYRKLDIFSRQERVGLEQLLTEVLTALVERRVGRSMGQSGQSSSQHESRGGGGGGGQQRYSQHRHQQSQQHRGRGYHQGMDSGDNFLEYVRNLEKRGGGAGKFRR